MKVFQNIVAAPVVPVADTGAKIGDKILFSPHHPDNSKDNNFLFLRCGITANKLYIVSRITAGGDVVFNADNGIISQCGGYGYRGTYDIIERAPEQPAPKPEFQPVTITLETQEEVNLYAALTGSLRNSVEHAFGVRIPQSTYEELDGMASPTRKSLELAELK